MEAIIFDMDGLMINSEKLYFDTEREIAKSFGKEVSDETLWNMMGRSPQEAIGIFIKDLDLPITVEEMRVKRDEIMLGKYMNDVEALKGLYEILDEFHNKLKLAIATGAPKKFLDITLDKLKLRKYFDALQSSDEISNGKPDPEIYLKACGKLNIEPEKCFVLEDSSNGALAGKRAGCYSIGVASDYNGKQNFDFVDYFAKDLLDARDHIKSCL